MYKTLAASACTALAVAALAFSTAPSRADTNVWTGRVVHISTTNLKVHNKDGNETLSFLLVPKFKQVFSDNGKTTYQMAEIKPGMWVTIYYDQDLLGARHADKIVVLNTGDQIKS